MCVGDCSRLHVALLLTGRARPHRSLTAPPGPRFATQAQARQGRQADIRLASSVVLSLPAACGARAGAALHRHRVSRPGPAGIPNLAAETGRAPRHASFPTRVGRCRYKRTREERAPHALPPHIHTPQRLATAQRPRVARANPTRPNRSAPGGQFRGQTSPLLDLVFPCVLPSSPRHRATTTSS